MTTSFALLGAAGFVAPRHMRAIAEVGGDLTAACDPHDSVGILDSHFPNCAFFTEFERFDRHVDKLQRSVSPLTHLVVCSPNYLHDAHVRYGLRSGMDVICEKPLVLNPWNLDGLAEIEDAASQRVYTILQLRHHSAIQELRASVAGSGRDDFEVDLTYITSRGRWYQASWKGDDSKSGGVATNIGVHFFDMLTWIFGKPNTSLLHLREADRMAGVLQLERARVRWFLSVDARDLPGGKTEQPRTHRSIKVDNDEVEFSEGFTDLHTASYEAILKGQGFGIQDVRPSIEIVSSLRTAPIDSNRFNLHPLAERHL